GDKFLMRFGYTIVWVGWEFDVAPRDNAMRIHVPVATDAGKPITGVVSAAWTANAAGRGAGVTDLVLDAAGHADGGHDRVARGRRVPGVDGGDVQRGAARQVARERAHRDARRRIRGRQDVPRALPRRESTGCRPRIRGDSRHGVVAQASAGRHRARSLRVRLRIVAEWPLPARVPVRRLQHG